MIRKQFKTLFLSILLFPLSVFAENTATTQYVPYNNILLDRTGKVIIDESKGVKKLFYQDNYWIAQLNLDIPIGNIAQADDFKYAFEKQGNILIFKLRNNLTYLGSERIAYYYKDTELSVLIDTDGNLITPKNTYYKSIGPFANNFAEVVTQNGQKGYLNLNGQFLLTLPMSASPKEINLSKFGENYCRPFTSDKIIYICNSNHKGKIININTGKELFIQSYNQEYNEYKKKFYTPTYKFWIRNFVSGHWLDQLYDYDLNLLYEGELTISSPFYGNTAWVYQHGQGYHLINSSGKILSDDYYSFKIVKSGNDVLFYARKEVDDKKNNGRYDKQYLTTILDTNGNILFYEDELGNNELNSCHRTISVLKNAEHKIVWPVDIEKACLVDRYINTPIKINSYDLGYREKDEQDKDNYPLVPKDKVAEITDYLLRKEAINLEGSFRSNGISGGGKYLTGPKKIIIDNFAELDLPEGYIYNEVLREKIYPCDRYVIPAYSKSGKMCISIHNLGYINLIKQKNNFDKNINIIKEKVEDRLPYYYNNDDLRYVLFDWFVEPELNISENSLKFGYYYHAEEINEKLLQTNIVGFKLAYLKFGKDDVLIVNNNDNDNLTMKDQIDNVDWSKRIKILEPYQYNSDSNYLCAQLSMYDSTLSSGYYDYFGPKHCFPGPVTRFIYQESSASPGYDTTLMNALELTEYKNLTNEHSYLFQRKFR